MKPNFFIIGAPKCGTTALSAYLHSHPQIFISAPKEPHFFATDLPGYKSKRTFERYLTLFNDNKQHYQRSGEASVYYLYSREAVENIFSFNNQARLIVMLRNPIQLVHSLHSQLLYSRNEDIDDFKTAWEAQEARQAGKLIPRYCTDAKILQYKQVGMLGEQIYRLFNSSFKREQIHVIFFEDFICNTLSIYKQTLMFLDLKDDGRQDFPVVNANTRHRIAWLGGLYINTSPWLTRLVKTVKQVLGIRQFNLSRHIARLNTAETKRSALSIEMKQVLHKVYADDIKRLGELTNRDLSAWLT